MMTMFAARRASSATDPRFLAFSYRKWTSKGRSYSSAWNKWSVRGIASSDNKSTAPDGTTSGGLFASPVTQERRRCLLMDDLVRSSSRSISSSSSSRTMDADRDEKDKFLNKPSPVLMVAQAQLDFFGEPVTFLLPTSNDNADSSKPQKMPTGTVSNSNISTAIAAMDAFLLASISKGQTCTEGGDEAGLHMQPAHAAAVSWSEALRFASVWNANSDESETDGTSDTNHRGTSVSKATSNKIVVPGMLAPMLAVVAVAPLLVQSGVAYLKHLDTLLLHTRPIAPGMPPIQLYAIAQQCVVTIQQNVHSQHLTIRERYHVQALEYLLHEQYREALVKYVQLLRQCPGDVLALSLALDLAHTIGDDRAALKVVGSVASYWHERGAGGGWFRPSLPGHALAASLIALGMAVGGRVDVAEPWTDRALQKRRSRSVAGALATWAQTYVLDASGRVAEGNSALANSDGIANYEGCGFLFFEGRLGGYGARFAVDREERGRGKSKALRLYDEHFQRVLDYSGFAEGKPWTKPEQKAPLGWSTSALQIEQKDRPSFFSSLFSRSNESDEKNPETEYEIVTKGGSAPSTRVENWNPTCEDVLTWIPPTPLFLCEATLLLLRFTLNGTIARSNYRWTSLRKAWKSMLHIQQQHKRSLAFSPLVCVTASILFPPSETGANTVGSDRLGLGLFLMGQQLALGHGNQEGNEQSLTVKEVQVAEREPDFWLPSGSDEEQAQWRTIVDHLASALDDVELSGTTGRFQTWTFDGRPILEHAIVYACCKSGDVERLCLARSISSQGVILRPNSPEEWWRYSIVLGLLGDEVASEDALNTSINVGAGQGARRV